MPAQQSGVPLGLEGGALAMREKMWRKNTVPWLPRGRSREVLAQLLALVQAGRSARESTLRAGRQIGERKGLRAAVRGEASGALDGLACRDGRGGDASSQSGDSDEGDDGFLEEHCFLFENVV